MPCSGIRTHNISRQAVADLRLRTRGHWELLRQTYSPQKIDIGREKTLCSAPITAAAFLSSSSQPCGQYSNWMTATSQATNSQFSSHQYHVVLVQ